MAWVVDRINVDTVLTHRGEYSYVNNFVVPWTTLGASPYLADLQISSIAEI